VTSIRSAISRGAGSHDADTDSTGEDVRSYPATALVAGRDARARNPDSRASAGGRPCSAVNGELRARRELPGARGGQPLRRRHQLLPEHRRGEPVVDGHRQRDARRGSRARTPRLSISGDRNSTDGRTCYGRRPHRRAGHLRSDGRPCQAGDLSRAGRPGGAGRPERPHRRRGQERVEPRPVPGLRGPVPAAQRDGPGCGVGAQDARPAAVRRRRSRRPGDLHRDVRRDGQRSPGPLLPGGAPVPVRPYRRGHLGGRPGRRRQGDGGETLRERSRRRQGTQRDDAEIFPRERDLPGRPLAGS
jgi:hypothetical protein